MNTTLSISPAHVERIFRKGRHEAMEQQANHPDNVWYAGEVVKHSPNRFERIVHFLLRRRLPTRDKVVT
jgi:hypothetical protein